MHLPVLWKEVLEYLDPAPGNTVFDATYGAGGHSSGILKRITPGGRIIAVDKDPQAVVRIIPDIEEYKDNITIVNDDFRNIENILKDSGIEKIDGAIFDLGLSSFQIDEEDRGFSFRKDGPLDMRFDRAQRLTAKEIVNKFGKAELADIIKRFGEERYAVNIAGAICVARKKREISTTGDLVNIIEHAVGRKYRNQRIHSAARTFQAIRICVNDELSAIEEAVPRAIDLLNTNGRIAVISFHSLEDRIIKNIFRDNARSGIVKILTKKPLTPEREEIMENPRSRSAKLRVAEKLI